MRKILQSVVAFACVLMLSLPGAASTTCLLKAAMGQCQTQCMMAMPMSAQPTAASDCCCGSHANAMLSTSPQQPAPAVAVATQSASDSVTVHASAPTAQLTGLERPHRSQASRRVLLCTFRI